MFILLLQTIWLFISELAGKDLDLSVILKFLIYATPRLIPMVLPLTVLLTSIMIFGNFAENYEFAAMKSSGISLQRAMRTLSIFIFFVGIGAFLFSNTVIPSSERKFVNLRKNIVKLKPALAITANQFNDLGNINIRVSEKHGDNDQFLEDVIIHKKGDKVGNFTVIKAVDGELKGSVDSNLITLVLNDGNYYDEIQQKSSRQRKKSPFAKTYFKQYVLNIDLSSLDDVDMDAQQYDKGYNMLNVTGLKEEIDTISKQVNNEVKSTKNEIDRRNGFKNLNKNIIIDTLHKEIIDTLDLINDRFNVKQKAQIYNLSVSNVEGVLRRIQSAKTTLKKKRRGLNKYEMSLHNKYALGIGCVLLFFVGAPLGAIIRKGGLGLPIVIGVVFFLTYHFIGIFAKNGAEEGGIPPFVGSWLSTFIIFPLSIFLTYRATRDRGFVSFDFIVLPIKNFFGQFYKPQNLQSNDLSTIDDFSKIVLDQNTIVKAESLHKNFKENSILTIALFIILTLVNIVIFLLSKDSGDSKIMLLLFNVLGIIAYLIFYIKSYIDYQSFYKLIKEVIPSPSLLLFYIIGLPLYPLIYFLYVKRNSNDLNQIRQLKT